MRTWRMLCVAILVVLGSTASATARPSPTIQGPTTGPGPSTGPGPVIVSGGGTAHRNTSAPLDADALAQARSAARVVTSLWGPGLPARIEVDVPPDLAGFVGDTGGAGLSSAGAAGIAAVAVMPARIVLNPEVYPRLSSVGRQIVLRHELVHLASRTVTPPSTPTWLVEGTADAVGYSGEPLTVRRAAAELAAEIGVGMVPSALPGDAAFDGVSSRLPQTYEEAWLACRLIAGRVGMSGLVRFYREAGEGRGSADDRLREAFADVLHTTQEEFTADWRAYLRENLG